MKPIIPSTPLFILYLIMFYWGMIILTFPVTVTGTDIAYTGILLSILLVDWLNKRYK